MCCPNFLFRSKALISLECWLLAVQSWVYSQELPLAKVAVSSKVITFSKGHPAFNNRVIRATRLIPLLQFGTSLGVTPASKLSMKLAGLCCTYITVQFLPFSLTRVVHKSSPLKRCAQVFISELISQGSQPFYLSVKPLEIPEMNLQVWKLVVLSISICLLLSQKVNFSLGCPWA